MADRLCVSLCCPARQEKQLKIGDPASQKAMDIEKDLTTLTAKLGAAEGTSESSLLLHYHVSPAYAVMPRVDGR